MKTSVAALMSLAAAACFAQQPADWSRYEHAASQTSFAHPSNWRVIEGPAGVMLLPADFDPDRELIIGFGVPANGITNAAAPQVQQHLDQFIMQQAPVLRRTTPPAAITLPGASGAAYTYRGVRPDGVPAVCTVLVRVADGAILAFSLIADEQRLAQRLPTVQRVFQSLKSNAPQPGPGADRPNSGNPANPGQRADVGDRRLIGMWRGEAYAGGTDIGVHVNTQIVYAFGADGRVYNGAQSHFAAAERDYNQELMWTFHGQTGDNVRGGRWQAANGMLTINWDDGTRNVVAYGFEPDGTLVSRNPHTRKLINFYTRVR